MKGWDSINTLELSVIAVGLSMDAFAVALCIGITMSRVSAKRAIIVGLYFGIFQGVMPIIGYFVAMQFAEMVYMVSHWVVFVLLAGLGAKMLWGSIKSEKCIDRECGEIPCTDRKCPRGRQEILLKPQTMIPLAFATSVDAMAVGVSFAFLRVNILGAVLIIGAVTFILSMAGVKIGKIFGVAFKAKAEIAGGIILILMGLSVLV